MFQAIQIVPLHSQWSGPNDTLNFNKAVHVQAWGLDRQFGSKKIKVLRAQVDVRVVEPALLNYWHNLNFTAE